MMKNHLPKDYKCCCIRCDREIKSCDKDDIFPPSKAMAFFTSGNYGTSLFDAPLVDRGELCIFLCDDCGSKMKDLLFISIVKWKRKLLIKHFSGMSLKWMEMRFRKDNRIIFTESHY